MSTITLLPNNLINKIAAGEVVERPSSAVKELVENAIDAKSTYIKVCIENKLNLFSIKVIDNGVGISHEDKDNLLKLHSTSKIKNFEDLYKLNTYGFRGEALATIASVCSEVEIASKKENEEGFTLKYFNNQKISTSTANISTKSGTSVHIKNLFEKVPARLKFLKNTNTELKHIITIFLSLAIPNLTIHFELYVDNRLIYNLPATSRVKYRIGDVWDENISKHFITVKIEHESYQVDGCIIDPIYCTRSTDKQFIFINKRYVYDKVIQTSINKAYSNFIHKELKPSYFINIHIPSENLDVNIHPRKLEVKYEYPDKIFNLVYKLVESTLHENQKSKFFDSASIQSDKIVTENNEIDNRNVINNEKVILLETNDHKSLNHKQSKLTNNKFSKVNVYNYSKSTLNEKISISKISETLLEYGTKKENYLYPVQIFRRYIIYESEDNLIFIDQHAAAEKIQFENLINKYLSNKIEPIPLLIPEVRSLNLADKKKILELKDEILKTGINIEDFGNNDISITHIPSTSKNFDIDSFLRDLLNDEVNAQILLTKDGSYVEIPNFIYSTTALIACHGSIRSGQTLTTDEMRNIISEISKLKNSLNCPHGRPITWIMNKAEIEKNFKRII